MNSSVLQQPWRSLTKQGGRLVLFWTLAPRPRLQSGKAYNGDVSLFNKPYVASYEPITDASGAVIGAYFVGIKK